MRAFIVSLTVVCFAACASAGYLAAPVASGYAAPALHSTGSSSQFREEDSYGNYKFGYDETSATGSSGRREERYGDVVRGSYNLGVHDGRARRVDYIADAAGFRATVHTNEPGVDSTRDPAAVLINKEGYAAVPAPEPVYSAPAPVYSAPAPAPVYSAPAPILAAPAAYGAPAPVAAAYQAPRQAFSYAFGSAHPAPAYVAPAPAPVYAAPAPILAAPVYQQARKY